MVDHADGDAMPLVVLEGRRGAGRTMLARGLAASRGGAVLHVQLTHTGDQGSAIRDALLFQRLHGGVIVVDGIDAWCSADPSAAPRTLPHALAAAAGPVVLRVDAATRWQGLLRHLRVARLAVPSPPVAGRAGRLAARTVWHRAGVAR